MNSRLDWLVLSDYYSIYVTNASPGKRNTNTVFQWRSYFLYNVKSPPKCYPYDLSTIWFKFAVYG